MSDANGPVESGSSAEETPSAAASGEAAGAADPAGGGRRVRVVLVDDHRMFRTGVQAEIGQTERTGVEVVGEAADVDQAVTVITATRPEVVLLDVHLPGGGGVEVLRRCAPLMADAEQPVRFLALSVSDAAEDVIGVIRGGARGTSPRRSPARTSWTPSSVSRTATRSSHPASPGSSWTRSPRPTPRP